MILPSALSLSFRLWIRRMNSRNFHFHSSAFQGSQVLYNKLLALPYFHNSNGLASCLELGKVMLVLFKATIQPSSFYYFQSIHTKLSSYKPITINNNISNKLLFTITRICCVISGSIFSNFLLS